MEVLQSSTSLNCLLYFCARGEGRVEDIAELFGLNPREVSENISHLEREYVITGRTLHGSLYYSLNPSWYFAGELQSLLQKIISCLPYEEQQKLLQDPGTPTFK